MRDKKLIIGAAALVGAVIVGITGVRVSRDSTDASSASTTRTASEGAADRVLAGAGNGRALPPEMAGTDRLLPMHEQRGSAAPEAQPPQTYIGPDGKEHPIVYNKSLRLTDQQQAETKKIIMDDMKRHPEAFAQIYGMELEEIQLIVQGKREFPHEIMLQLVRQ
jgi:hypothetical protein